MQSRIEALFLHGLVLFLKPWPTAWIRLWGRTLGWVLFSVFRLRRGVTLENLSLALGGESGRSDLLLLCRQCYVYFGGLFFEFLAMPRQDRNSLSAVITLENPQVFDEALGEGKGAILVSGHLGHWELMGGALSSSDYPLTMYVGKQKNPYVDTLFNTIRGSLGTETISKGVALRGMVRALRAGRIVAMLADQHYSHKRHYIRFFNQPVSAAPGPASLALRTGAPVIFGACTHSGGGRYRARFQRIQPQPSSGTVELDLLRLSQQISDALEAEIRRRPEQYFWPHRRWRPIPPSVQLTAVNQAFLAESAPGEEESP